MHWLNEQGLPNFQVVTRQHPPRCATFARGMQDANQLKLRDCRQEVTAAAGLFGPSRDGSSRIWLPVRRILSLLAVAQKFVHRGVRTSAHPTLCRSTRCPQ